MGGKRENRSRNASDAPLLGDCEAELGYDLPRNMMRNTVRLSASCIALLRSPLAGRPLVSMNTSASPLADPKKSKLNFESGLKVSLKHLNRVIVQDIVVMRVAYKGVVYLELM